jgi:hypothetical protein
VKIKKHLLPYLAHISDKSCVLHFIFNNFFSKIMQFMGMLKNFVEPRRSQMTVRRLGITRWIRKGTDTRSEYVIPTAFPFQSSLLEGARMLC